MKKLFKLNKSANRKQVIVPSLASLQRHEADLANTRWREEERQAVKVGGCSLGFPSQCNKVPNSVRLHTCPRHADYSQSDSDARACRHEAGVMFQPKESRHAFGSSHGSGDIPKIHPCVSWSLAIKKKI